MAQSFKKSVSFHRAPESSSSSRWTQPAELLQELQNLAFDTIYHSPEVRSGEIKSEFYPAQQTFPLSVLTSSKTKYAGNRYLELNPRATGQDFMDLQDHFIARMEKEFSKPLERVQFGQVLILEQARARGGNHRRNELAISVDVSAEESGSTQAIKLLSQLTGLRSIYPEKSPRMILGHDNPEALHLARPALQERVDELNDMSVWLSFSGLQHAWHARFR